MTAALGVTAFTVLGAEVTYGALLQTTLIVGSAVHARKKAKQARRRALDSIEDRTIMVRTATLPRPIVLGRAKLSGAFFPLGTSGPDGERFHFVLPLANACDGIDAVWVGDKRITQWDANGWVTEAPFSRAKPQLATQSYVIPASRVVTFTGGDVSEFVSVAKYIDPTNFGDNGAASAPPLYEGDPDTDPGAYSKTYSSPTTTIKFHPSLVGAQVVVTYRFTATSPVLRVKFFDGTQSSADPYLTQELPERWTSAHVGFGVSYLAVTMVYDQDVYPGGIPNFAVEMRGERVYDQRTGVAAHTANNALHARHLLKTVFGCADSQIDDATVIAAANACDEALLAGEHYEPRYTFDGALSTEMSPMDMLEAVLDAMMGYAVRSAGKWHIYAGVWRPPTLALTDEDFANDSIVVQARQSRRDVINGARARYTNDSWVVTDAPAWVSPTYVAEDGGEAVADLDLQYVRGVHRAQRIEKRSVLQARQALTVNAAYKMSAYEVSGGDVIELTLSSHGIIEKPFLVADRTADPQGTIRLALREVAQAIDDWSFNESITPDPAPNTNLPDPRFVPAPVLTFGSGAQFMQVLADGTKRPFIRVYWQQFDATVEWVELQWRRAGETQWQRAQSPADHDSFDIFNVARDETYIIIARAINGVQVRSEWSIHSVQVDTSTYANGPNFGFGVGVNQIPNASLSNTSAPWVVEAAGSEYTTGEDYFNFDGYNAFCWGAPGTEFADLRPKPLNSIGLYSNAGAAAFVSGQMKYLYLKDWYLPVKPGDYVEAQIRVGNLNGGAWLEIYWVPGGKAPYDYSHRQIAEGDSQGVFRGQGVIGAFDHLVQIAKVPDGVTGAYPMIHFLRDQSAQAGWTTLAMPYFGLARANQTEPSEWNAGPSGGKIDGLDIIDTDLLDLNAATDVIAKSVGAGETQDLGGGLGRASSALITQIDYTNPYDRPVTAVVTATVVLWGYANAASLFGSGSVRAFVSDGANTLAAQVVITGNYTSAPGVGTATLIHRAEVPAKASITRRLTVGTSYWNGYSYEPCGWNSAEMRLEIIKA